jgi:hypothetical protein
VREMARKLGVAGDSRLWVGVLKLVRSEEDIESFEEADEEGRKCILAHLSGVGNWNLYSMHAPVCGCVGVEPCNVLNFIVYACVVLICCVVQLYCGVAC